MCRSKRHVGEVLIDNEYQSGDNFLGIIYSETDSLSSQPWTTTLTVNNRPLQFKIDTGADVTVISEEEYCQQPNGPLQPTHRVLSGPSQHPLDI